MVMKFLSCLKFILLEKVIDSKLFANNRRKSIIPKAKFLCYCNISPLKSYIWHSRFGQYCFFLCCEEVDRSDTLHLFAILKKVWKQLFFKFRSFWKGLECYEGIKVVTYKYTIHDFWVTTSAIIKKYTFNCF